MRLHRITRAAPGVMHRMHGFLSTYLGGGTGWRGKDGEQPVQPGQPVYFTASQAPPRMMRKMPSPPMTRRIVGSGMKNINPKKLTIMKIRPYRTNMVATKALRNLPIESLSRGQWEGGL